MKGEGSHRGWAGCGCRREKKSHLCLEDATGLLSQVRLGPSVPRQLQALLASVQILALPESSVPCPMTWWVLKAGLRPKLNIPPAPGLLGPSWDPFHCKLQTTQGTTNTPQLATEVQKPGGKASLTPLHSALIRKLWETERKKAKRLSK